MTTENKNKDTSLLNQLNELISKKRKENETLKAIVEVMAKKQKDHKSDSVFQQEKDN